MRAEWRGAIVKVNDFEKVSFVYHFIKEIFKIVHDNTAQRRKICQSFFK